MSLYKPFNCECLSKDHTLNVYFDKEAQMVEFNFGLIFSNPDYKKGFLKGMFWRIKHALVLLFTGHIVIEDTWLSSVDDNAEFKRFVEYYHYYFVKSNYIYGVADIACCSSSNKCSEQPNGNIEEKKEVKKLKTKKSGNK